MPSNKQPKVDMPRRKSGRAVIEDGRSIWEWQTQTGVFERDVDTQQLRALEDANLSLVADDATVRSGSYYVHESAPITQPRARTHVQAKSTVAAKNGGVLSRLFRRTLRRD
jgi:hypothetical protein